jgi:hypothetical protein
MFGCKQPFLVRPVVSLIAFAWPSLPFLAGTLPKPAVFALQIYSGSFQPLYVLWKCSGKDHGLIYGVRSPTQPKKG